MKIAIDVSPLSIGHHLQHRVRGTGFYLTNLKEALLKYFPENDYLFFKQGDNLPKNIDIVHYPYFEPYFLTLPVKKDHKRVVTVHDLTPLVFKDKFPPGLKGSLKWQIQKKSLQSSEAIITDSLSSKKDIHKYADIDINKIHSIHLASASHFKSHPKDKKIIEKYQLPEEFLLYVGDVTWNKNLPGLIKAVNETSYSLVIAGGAFVNKDYDRSNPWNKGLYEAQVLAEQNKNIFALGFVPDEDLAKLYNSATVFIMPSFYEGFGLPILEAMQSGCPVITTKEGSLEEVADSAAYFVDPNDTNSIKNGIEEVMTGSELRQALTEKGLGQAEKFSWKKTAEETIEVYKRILNDE